MAKERRVKSVGRQVSSQVSMGLEKMEEDIVKRQERKERHEQVPILETLCLDQIEQSLLRETGRQNTNKKRKNRQPKEKREKASNKVRPHPREEETREEVREANSEVNDRHNPLDDRREAPVERNVERLPEDAVENHPREHEERVPVNEEDHRERVEEKKAANFREMEILKEELRIEQNRENHR